MFALPAISQSEWRLMEALWESSPQTASELTKALRPTMNWAKNTVRTLVTRLISKGELKTGESASGTRTYMSAVKRETCVRTEGGSFILGRQRHSCSSSLGRDAFI